MNKICDIVSRLWLLGLSMGLLAVLPACTTVEVAPDTIGNVKLGELQVFADRDFETAYAAAKRGIADYKLFLTGDEKKVIEAELNARDGADSLVTVKIKEVAKGRTSVKIRYGIPGDIAQAQRLYREIAKHY
ncbi:MAG TPA: DUF3568 family protein [Opitutaceae bacterium]